MLSWDIVVQGYGSCSHACMCRAEDGELINISIAAVGKESLFRGMLVSLPQKRGVGKLEVVDGDMCSVAVFRSIMRSETVRLPLAALRRAYLSPQTRVYVRDEERFRVGRVTDFLTSDNGLIDYEVRFPNGKRADFSELSLFLRPWSAPDDPAEVLVLISMES